MGLTFTSPNKCCCCTIAIPEEFSQWREITTSPSYVSPPTNWDDDGGGAISTTTTGKIVYATQSDSATLSKVEATLDLDGVAHFGNLTGTGVKFIFDSSAETITAPSGSKACSIGPPPWDLVYCDSGGIASISVNGSEIIADDVSFGNFRQWKLDSGTSMALSDYRVYQRGTENGRVCGIECLPDAWYPRHRVDEITVTVAGITNSTCTDCTSKNGTFVLPFYSASSGTATYRLTGTGFGCSSAYMQASFFSGSLFDATAVWGMEIKYKDSTDQFGYYFKKYSATLQPCGTTLNFSVSDIWYNSLSPGCGVGSATIEVSY